MLEHRLNVPRRGRIMPDMLKGLKRDREEPER